MKKLIVAACACSLMFLSPACLANGRTTVSIKGDKWYINGEIINKGSPAEGLLLNVRMVNAIFEDRGNKMPAEFSGFDAGMNTDEFIKKIPEYVKSGINAFTISLQGGAPGYEGAVNTAFEPDGSLRKEYFKRAAKVIRAADRNQAIIILSCFYQRQHSHFSALGGNESIKKALLNVAGWIAKNGFRNVIIEISNEYLHAGYRNWNDGQWIASHQGQTELIELVKSRYPGLITGTSGMGNGIMNEAVARAADYITIHFNNTPLPDYPAKIAVLKIYGKPLICNEDDKLGSEGAAALKTSVINGCGWGYMNSGHNQTIPFHFDGASDDTIVYSTFSKLSAPAGASFDLTCFPQPDSLGGWRSLSDAEEVRKITRIDRSRLDEAFRFARTTSRNGGLLVLRNGWLVYENYWGKGQREAVPNLASCGKSFTSIAVGILMHEHPELFPDGLDQKIFTPRYLPEEAFPLPDERMKDIKLGQLLAFTAGIRGNNPVRVMGRTSWIDPAGPDGWYALVDDYALGRKDGIMNGKPFTTRSLWCEPGGGYSYATASIHIASIMLRHITGMELEEFLRSRIAGQLGWGKWSFGYKNSKLVTHTPGGGGIALRSTDMLRFGYLLLQKGRWEEKQVVPADYVARATSASLYNPHSPYSLQFNVNSDGHAAGLPGDTFWKAGSGGHCLFVVPSLDLVVWKLGGRDDQYSPSNTGLPGPEPLLNSNGPTEQIINAPDDGDYETTLKMVIGAIID